MGGRKYEGRMRGGEREDSKVGFEPACFHLPECQNFPRVSASGCNPGSQTD